MNQLEPGKIRELLTYLDNGGSIITFLATDSDAVNMMGLKLLSKSDLKLPFQFGPAINHASKKGDSHATITAANFRSSHSAQVQGGAERLPTRNSNAISLRRVTKNKGRFYCNITTARSQWQKNRRAWATSCWQIFHRRWRIVTWRRVQFLFRWFTR